MRLLNTARYHEDYIMACLAYAKRYAPRFEATEAAVFSKNKLTLFGIDEVICEIELNQIDKYFEIFC